MFESDRIWYSSTRAHRTGDPLIARLLKLANFLMFRSLLPFEAEVAPDVRMEHYRLCTVVHPNVTVGRRVRIFHHETLATESVLGSELNFCQFRSDVFACFSRGWRTPRSNFGTGTGRQRCSKLARMQNARRFCPASPDTPLKIGKSRAEHRIVIGHDVMIGAGAIVIGRGNRGLTIGAGAVVTGDVGMRPQTAGVPSRSFDRVEVTS